MPPVTNLLIFTSALLAVAPSVSCSSNGVLGDGMADSGATDQACTPLVIDDPAASFDGYALFSPAERRNNPNAGDPSYVFLAAGREAVVIDGPAVTSAPGLFTLANPSITLVGARDFSADGYEVVANAGLHYSVTIRDFEYEVALARVELCEKSQAITSRFTFRGNPQGSGVAFDITITGAAGGAVTPPTTPVTVEVR